MSDVVGDVGHVEPEPDHRRLVADRVDPAQGRDDDVGVGDVALDELGVGVEVVGGDRVGGVEQRVEDTDLAALGDAAVDDVRTDEAGAAGDEDHDLANLRHASVLGYVRRVVVSPT